jgi:hypothetical protein
MSQYAGVMRVVGLLLDCAAACLLELVVHADDLAVIRSLSRPERAPAHGISAF